MDERLEIFERVRQETLDKIQGLPHAHGVRDDIIVICATVQEAVNALVASLGRPIHESAAPTALRLMADEIDRIAAEFRAAGLMAPRVS